MTSYITKDAFRKLNEKERRILAAQYAVDYGYGGIAEMHRRYGISRTTVARGIRELNAVHSETDRIRKEGGGRKAKGDTVYPDLDQKVLELAEEDDQKSLRRIAEELHTRYDIRVSFMTVSRILKKSGKGEQ